MEVTVTVIGQFVIEADNETDYEKLRENMLDQFGDMGLELGIESEDTDDGKWFDDEKE